MRLLIVALFVLPFVLAGAEHSEDAPPAPKPPPPHPWTMRDQDFWYGRTSPEPFPRYPITQAPIIVVPPRTSTDEALKQEQLNQQQWLNQQQRLREGDRQNREFHQKLEQESERIRNEAR